jgi:hypothetical protein
MRPRKPKHLKLISGTDQPCRRKPDEDVGAPVLEDVPQPPDWLPNAHATREFKRLAPIAMRLGRLTEANVSAFALLCSVHGKIVQLLNAGEMPTGFLFSQYRAFASDFGLQSVISAIPRKIGSEPEKKGRFDRFKQPD